MIRLGPRLKPFSPSNPNNNSVVWAAGVDLDSLAEVSATRAVAIQAAVAAIPEAAEGIQAAVAGIQAAVAAIPAAVAAETTVTPHRTNP